MRATWCLARASAPPPPPGGWARWWERGRTPALLLRAGRPPLRKSKALAGGALRAGALRPCARPAATMERGDVIAEMQRGEFPVEPEFAPTDEQDDHEVRTVWSCAKCPLAPCNFKSSKTWSYVSEVKVRRMVADHVCSAGKHEMWDKVDECFSIAADPERTVVTEYNETFEDRSKQRKKWKLDQQRYERQQADKAQMASAKGSGRHAGAAASGRGQKRPADDNSSSQIEDLQNQVLELTQLVTSGAAGSAGVSMEETMGHALLRHVPKTALQLQSKTIKLNAESLQTMDEAFSQLALDVTAAIKGLSKVSGELAKSEAEIAKIVAFIKKLKEKLAPPA